MAATMAAQSGVKKREKKWEKGTNDLSFDSVFVTRRDCTARRVGAAFRVRPGDSDDARPPHGRDRRAETSFESAAVAASDTAKANIYDENGGTSERRGEKVNYEATYE